MLHINFMTIVAGLAALRSAAGAPLINELVTAALTPPAPPAPPPPPHSHSVAARSPDREGPPRRPAGGLLSGLTDAAEELRGALSGRPRSATLRPPPLPKLPPLVPAAVLNRGLGRALSTVSILGQVDSYIAERARALVRKLLLLVSDEDLMAEYYRSQQPYDNAVA